MNSKGILFNLILIVATAVITFFVVEKKICGDDLPDTIDINEKKVDSLKLIIKDMEIKYDSLSEVKQEKIVEYITLKSNLNKTKNEKDSIINSVYTLDERMLDSTIRTYKHIKGTED